MGDAPNIVRYAYDLFHAAAAYAEYALSLNQVGDLKTLDSRL